MSTESGFLKLLGVREGDPHSTDRPGDDAGLVLATTDEQANVNGGVHGGVLATLLDSVMGEAVRNQLGEGKSAVTVAMNVTYLSAAKPGEELTASAEVRRRGDSLMMAEADVVRGDDHKPVAHGVATYSVIDK